MTSQQKTLTLKCPSCGAPLEVAPDMERFVCGYCGTEQVVERRGGTVTLKLLGDAIAKVQVGTDRTAAELAIRRLRDDLAALDEQQKQRRMERARKSAGPAAFFIIIAFISGFAAFIAFLMRSPAVGVPAICIFISSIVLLNTYSGKKDLEEIDREFASLRATTLREISKHEKFLKA